MSLGLKKTFANYGFLSRDSVTRNVFLDRHTQAYRFGLKYIFRNL
jgi:hypothetical protein